MNRFLFNGSNLQWIPNDSFPPFNPVVYTFTLMSAVLIIGTALIWRYREPDSSGITELAIMMMSLTIASPIAWEHHYGILLPIFAIAAPKLLSNRVFWRWTMACFLGAFLMASQRLDITNRLADTQLNIFQSYLFFAGIIVLFSLYRISLGNKGQSLLRIGR